MLNSRSGVLALAAAITVVAMTGVLLFADQPPPAGRTTATVAGGVPAQRAGARTPAPSIAAEHRAPASVHPWLTYMGTPLRNGDVADPALTGGLRQRWRSPQLDGDVYAEPLVDGDETIVATEEDSVYGLALADGHVLWRTSIGHAVHRHASQCKNLDQIGITSTPVIDSSTDTLYVVGFAEPGRHLLTALDAAKGTVRFSRPVDPPGEDPLVLGQRGALAITAGHVYIPFGGRNGDCGQYHGWLVGVRLDGSGAPVEWKAPAVHGDAIWSPSGITVDPAGNLLVATGNSTAGEYAPRIYDQANSVLRFSPRLAVLDWYAPLSWADRNATDADLGSTGPTIVGGDHVFQSGKGGDAYLLRLRSLGHLGGSVAHIHVCASAYGATAYSARAAMALVGCTDGVYGVGVEPTEDLEVVWHQPGYWAGPPIVAGGVVLSVDVDHGVLHAFRAVDGASLAQLNIGPVVHFTTPTVAGSLVLVATRQGVVAVSG